MNRKSRYFVGDFETTVYEGQEYTEVWASACVELYTEDVKIFNSIGEQFKYLCDLNDNIVIYYHNLKFDGSFWLSYLLVDLGMKQAGVEGEELGQHKFYKTKFMDNNTFKYNISDMGQWYSITIKINNKIIEIRDSLKLLPFSVKRIGESFGTKHKKLDMEYVGLRYAGCEITSDEREYIVNDVLVVKEALEIIFDDGHDKLTIGACCLAEFKKSLSPEPKFAKIKYKELFPQVYDIPLKGEYECDNVGEWIHKSYRGGWVYVVKGKEKKIYQNGVTADVNSLYPSMMSSESGNRYPIGKPTFWKGNFIPEEAFEDDKYYFVHFKTRFYIKENKLPFIQIKNNLLYNGREMLESSDIKIDGEYYSHLIDENGQEVSTAVDLTMTMTDFQLLKEHYYLLDFEIIDGCFFDTRMGIFDEYIDKYRMIKASSKGAKRELAKLFLNNLYGKMASSPNSSYKVAYVKEDSSIGFYTVVENEKEAGYIPIGSAITSYARNFTIRSAQQNYYGKDKRGFIYADTDSIHCDLSADEVKGIKIHPTDFCCWKLESNWDRGIFVRPKTYIEHIVKEDDEFCEPYYQVKCAGMPERCKKLFIRSLVSDFARDDEELKDDERAFLSTPRTLTDFDIGLIVPSKLMPKRIKGGVVLKETTYEMR